MLIKILQANQSDVELRVDSLTRNMEVPKGTNINNISDTIDSKIEECKILLCEDFLEKLKTQAVDVGYELTQEDVDKITQFLHCSVSINSQYETVIISNDEEYPIDIIKQFVCEDKMLIHNDTLYDKTTLEELDYEIKLKTTVMVEGVLTAKEGYETITLMKVD